MVKPLVLLALLVQGGAATPFPATDIRASDIQATLAQARATKTTDTPIRTVDAGGHHVGVSLVQRPRGTGQAGGGSHDKVTEVYHVLEGSGTLVTGGTLVNPRRSENAQLFGPGAGGAAIQGGVSRRIAKGDLIVIPAGTPHGMSEVQEDITVLVVKVDPGRVISLK